MERETHKDEGSVEVLVILPGALSVKLIRFLAVDSEEVCAWVIGPQWLEELLEGGLEAGGEVIDVLMTIERSERTTPGRAGRRRVLVSGDPLEAAARSVPS